MLQGHHVQCPKTNINKSTVKGLTFQNKRHLHGAVALLLSSLWNTSNLTVSLILISISSSFIIIEASNKGKWEYSSTGNVKLYSSTAFEQIYLLSSAVRQVTVWSISISLASIGSGWEKKKRGRWETRDPTIDPKAAIDATFYYTKTYFFK